MTRLTLALLALALPLLAAAQGPPPGGVRIRIGPPRGAEPAPTALDDPEVEAADRSTRPAAATAAPAGSPDGTPALRAAADRRRRRAAAEADPADRITRDAARAPARRRVPIEATDRITREADRAAREADRAAREADRAAREADRAARATPGERLRRPKARRAPDRAPTRRRRAAPLDPPLMGTGDPRGRPGHWGIVETVTPLEAARRREEAGGADLEFARAVEFEHDSVRFAPHADAALAEVTATLQATPEVRLVLIEGHANAPGTLRYNQRLSEARASAVREALIRRGVAAERLVAYGYGETRPPTPDEPDNRRVLFRVVEADHRILTRRVATEWSEAAAVTVRGRVERRVADPNAPAPASPVAAAAAPTVTAAPPADAARAALGARTAPSTAAPPAAAVTPSPTAAAPDATAVTFAPAAAASDATAVTAAPAATAPDAAVTPSPADAAPAPDWTPLTPRASLPAGTTLRTAPDATTLLRLPDLTRLRLAPDTQATLTHLRYDHADARATTTLHLTTGALRVTANPLERRHARTRITFPGGALECTHADFELAITPTGRGHLRVERGQLTLTTATRTLPLPAGHAIHLGPQDALPVPLLPAPTPIAPLSGRHARAPLLTWHPLPGATAYLVELATDIDFDDLIIRAPTPDPRFDPRYLDPDRRYYWRVRAIDPTGHHGHPSPIHAFRTAPRDATPPAAARLAPR